MFNSKSIFYVQVYIVGLYLIISLFSCNKENPIEPPPPIPQDTTDEYEWRAVEEGAGLWGDLFVSDTSHIYLFYDNGTCYRYDGANIFEPVNFGDPYFSAYRAGSIDNQNIYFAGFTYFSTSYSPITIKKMKNGNVIQTWISSKDSASDGFGFIVTGEDDVWYGKEISSCVYHLNSNTITKYDLDSGLQYNYLWKDKFNNVYAFGYMYYRNPFTGITLYSYKFNGSRFERVSKDTLLYTLAMFPCGSDLLTKSIDWDLLYFSGTSWVPYISNPEIGIYKLGGNSKDTLINFALEYYPSTLGFSSYIWKGEHWKREKKLAELIRPFGTYEGGWQVQIKMFEDNVYFPADFGNYKYLIIGKKIKTNKL